MKMARIYSNNGEKPVIDQTKVLAFFEVRAEKAKKHDVNYKQAVIYQDKKPELAEARDQAEQTLLLPKFALTSKERFLDIGCGTGRWLHALHEQVAYYHGIDASNGLIEIAKQQFNQAHIRLTCLNAENISLDTLSESQTFDRILNVGVMMYLNEPELQKYLSAIPSLLAENGLFIVREPIALEKRLTLDLHYSEDMEQSYSAIYRTENELLELMNEAFDNKLQLIDSDFVFKEVELNHRAETKMKYFVFKAN